MVARFCRLGRYAVGGMGAVGSSMEEGAGEPSTAACAPAGAVARTASSDTSLLLKDASTLGMRSVNAVSAGPRGVGLGDKADGYGDLIGRRDGKGAATGEGAFERRQVHHHGVRAGALPLIDVARRAAARADGGRVDMYHGGGESLGEIAREHRFPGAVEGLGPDDGIGGEVGEGDGALAGERVVVAHGDARGKAPDDGAGRLRRAMGADGDDGIDGTRVECGERIVER